MPTTIYLRGGGKLTLKGETLATAVIKRAFGRQWSGVANNGHDITVFKKDVLAYELQTEAEAKKIEDDEKARQEVMAKASKCRRCGTMSPHEADFCSRCGSPLVKKQIIEPVALEIPGRKN